MKQWDMQHIGIFTTVRGCTPQRVASSSWLIQRVVRAGRTFAPDAFRGASFATPCGKDNGRFPKRLTWLEPDIDTGADHAEIVVGAVHNVPAKVAEQSNVRGNTNLEPAAKLAHRTGFNIVIDALKISANVNGRLIVAAESSATTRPDVRREPRLADRIPQSQGAKRTSDCVVVTVLESRCRAKILHRITGTVRCQSEAFDSNTKVAAKEIFHPRSAAEGMVACQETIVPARTRVGGKCISQAVTIVVCCGKRISKPGTYVPFIVAIPDWRGCRSWYYLFGRKGFWAGVGDVDKCKSD
jgi:hypothetical protein